MYGTIYTSSEYYDCYQYNPIINHNKNNNNNNNIISNNMEIITNNECIICWLPSTENTQVKCMKEHSFFVSNCDCNTFFHDTCLNKWLETKSTCPICCIKISIKNDKNTTAYMKIKRHTIIFYKNTCKILRLVSFFCSINVFILLFYILFFDLSIDTPPYFYEGNL